MELTYEMIQAARCGEPFAMQAILHLVRFIMHRNCLNNFKLMHL